MPGIFEGVKVLDFGWILVGPLISGYLARNGATVVKVESRKHPDMTRSSAPFQDGKPGLNRSGYYGCLNPNKYNMDLNLNLPQGIEIAKRLAAWAASDTGGRAKRASG